MEPEHNGNKARDVRGHTLWTMCALEPPALVAPPELTASCRHTGCQLAGEAVPCPFPQWAGRLRATGRGQRLQVRQPGERAPTPLVLRESARVPRRLRDKLAEPSGKRGVSGDWEWVPSSRSENRRKQHSSLTVQTWLYSLHAKAKNAKYKCLQNTSKKWPLNSSQPANCRYSLQNQMEAACGDLNFCLETLSSQLWCLA